MYSATNDIFKCFVIFNGDITSLLSIHCSVAVNWFTWLAAYFNILYELLSVGGCYITVNWLNCPFNN